MTSLTDKKLKRKKITKEEYDKLMFANGEKAGDSEEDSNESCDNSDWLIDRQGVLKIYAGLTALREVDVCTISVII